MRRSRPLVVPDRRLSHMRDQPHRRRRQIQPRPCRTPSRRKRAHLLLTPRRRRRARPVTAINGTSRGRTIEAVPPTEVSMNNIDEGLVLAYFIVSDDVERSRRFYTEVLGGRVAFSGPGGLTYVALSNSWIIINGGGGPTDDKPSVSLETPRDPDRVSSFLNIRVKDIAAVYAE